MLSRILVIIFASISVSAFCAETEIHFEANNGQVVFLINPASIAQQKVTASSLLPVYVKQDNIWIQIKGRYQAKARRILFKPNFNFIPGVGEYLARVTIKGKETSLEFSPPQDSGIEAGQAVAIYPGSNELPQNILRFYVEFSKPMSLGSLENYIRLETQTGDNVDAFFMNMSQPLWNGDRTRLTLLFEPGRIKRGIGSGGEMVGPALQVGEFYRLIINALMLDEDGLPLKSSLVKTFKVSSPIRKALSLDDISVSRFKPGKRDAVSIRFPVIVDYYQMRRSLRFFDGNRMVLGELAKTSDPHRFTFVPDELWVKTKYQLQISDTAEDISGNNFLAAFDNAIAK